MTSTNLTLIESLYAAFRTGDHTAFAALCHDDLEWIQNEVDLEDGDFTTQVSRLRANFSFTPEVSWNNFVQWDNVSDTFGINSRLRWIPEPGNEVFLVFNQLVEDDDALVSQFQQLAFKVTYTLRF